MSFILVFSWLDCLPILVDSLDWVPVAYYYVSLMIVSTVLQLRQQHWDQLVDHEAAVRLDAFGKGMVEPTMASEANSFPSIHWEWLLSALEWSISPTTTKRIQLFFHSFIQYITHYTNNNLPPYVWMTACSSSMRCLSVDYEMEILSWSNSFRHCFHSLLAMMFHSWSNWSPFHRPHWQRRPPILGHSFHRHCPIHRNRTINITEEEEQEEKKRLVW